MTEMISKLFFASFRTLPFVFLYGDQEPSQQAVENPSRARVNPISGRLLATPISGKGGLF